jgi:hypothetical protein
VGGNRFQRLKKLIQEQRKSSRMDIHFAAQSGRLEAWFTRQLRFLACVSGLFALFTLPVAAQTNPLVVSTVAGLANFGSADGIGSAAKFLLPASVAVDGAGNVYVADADNDTIRKVTPAGVVSTLAGTEQMSGTNDGTGSAARFNQPYGVAVDNSGNIYVTDSFNQTIRKITTNGVVTTFAGLAGTAGFRNGPATTNTTNGAVFSYPYGIAIDSSNNIYVADTDNNMIRVITNGSGTVATLAGWLIPGASNATGTNAQFNKPFALATDSAGNVYVADTHNYLIRRITSGGGVTTVAGSGSIGTNDGIGTNAQFAFPTGIAVDSAGNIYVADENNQIIRKITHTGTNWVVSTLAGDTLEFGDGDGISPQATFYNPWGVAVDSATNVYVGDSDNGNIRKITFNGTDWVVSTLAGPDGSYGLVNGPAAQARFNQPYGVAVDGATNLYVADYYNNCIREITPAGRVTTLAGSVNGDIGSTDGTNNNAEFFYPSGLCLDAATNIYVADSYNSTVRKITPDAAHSNWVTTTIAGQVGVYSFSNSVGTNALFYVPSAVAVDSATNLYVADTYNNVIRMITSNGTVSTYAGNPVGGYSNATGTNALFSSPSGIAVDSSTNVYVADSDNNAIRQIAPGGVVTTLTNGALFDFPEGVAVDNAGNVYVASTDANTILGIPHGSNNTTTIAGTAGLTGSADGLGSAAQFDSPIGLAVDASGNVYVADALNNTIRKGTPYTAGTVVLTLTTSPDGLPLEVNGTSYAYTPQVFALATNRTNTVTATTTNDYIFTNWTTTNGTVASSSNTYSFTLSSNETLVANFLPGYTLTVSASPANGGTVSGGGTFAPGSINTVTATANSGYLFANWTLGGTVESTSSNYMFTLASNETLVANFLPLYTLSVSASPTNGGTVSGGGTFVAGSTNTVTATANSGYLFANWTLGGTVESTSSNYMFTLASNETLVANFLPLYTLSVSASPTNGGTVSGGGTFVSGSTRTVTATANSGYLFVNWTLGGTVESTSSNYMFTLAGNETLVANFLPLYTLAVSASPTNGGTVRGGGTFVAGSTNTVTATANSGYLFANWTLGGIVASTSSNYTFTLGGNEMLVANFLTTSRPSLSITQSNGVTFLFWANSTNGFTLESTTNLTPAVWVVVTNLPALSGGFFTVSNIWSDQQRFFRLVAMSRPSLSITQSNGFTFLFWPSSATGFTLESTTNLNPANWAAVANPPVLSGGFFTVSNAWPDQTRFFRLISQ